MVIALGLVYSLTVGAGDYFGGFVSRRSRPLPTVITFLVAGTAVALVLVVFIPSELLLRDVGVGAASGLTVGFALVLLYKGMSIASSAVVSPAAALVAAVLPISWSISRGEVLSGLTFAGIAVALVGLGAATISPELGDRAKVGVAWGVGSGLCFGVSLTVLGQADIDSGMWAAVSQRFVAMVFLAAIATATATPRLVPKDLRRRAYLGGILGSIGVAAFVAGAQRGSLSEITITASTFPAITAILSALFDGHPMRWWQLGGIAVVVAGVVMIGIG